MTIQKGIWHLYCASMWLGLWLFGLGTLLCCLMHWWPGDRFLPVRLTNYLMPWLLVGLLPGLIAAALSHHNWLVMTLGISIIFICSSYAPLFCPARPISSTNEVPLKIMSYNVWRSNEHMNDAAEVIRREQPDILLLQELKPERAQILTKALVNLYPDAELQFAYEEKRLQAIISRFPLICMEKIHNKGRAQKVLIETPKGPIIVYNIHPPKGRWLRRHRQLSALLTEDIITSDSPVILGGDFNTNDQSATYRLLSQHLHNSHWEAGWGFGFTYPSASFRLRGKFQVPPLVRIDHIFYNDHFYIKNAGTLTESGGSDHLPVVAELILNACRS